MVGGLIRDTDCRDGCRPAAEFLHLSGYPDISRFLDVFPDQAMHFPVEVDAAVLQALYAIRKRQDANQLRGLRWRHLEWGVAKVVPGCRADAVEMGAELCIVEVQ